MICRDKNYDYYHKGREGGGQRAVIEISISKNDDNDGRPLTWYPVSVHFIYERECANGKECYSRIERCDGRQHCDDNSDELGK